MESITEFLEASSINGLAHISSGKNKLQKIFWVFVVVICLLFAAQLIISSLTDWAKNPVSTTIETFSIRDVTFPR